MCRNIKKLRHPLQSPSDEELTNAALQFIRKVSGFHKPSRRNEQAFNKAVADIASVTRVLFNQLIVEPGPSSLQTRPEEITA